MMKRQWTWAGLLLLLGLALIALGPARAVGNSAQIEWAVIDSGGGSATGGNVTIDASVGQPVAGQASAGETEVCAGFWCAVQEAFSALFLPVMVRE
jgi:hypothetical protein